MEEIYIWFYNWFFRIKFPEIIPRTVQILLRLASDEASVVAKRALRASGRILRAALKWIASATVVTTDMELAWTQLSALKVQIINMIDSDNDGWVEWLKVIFLSNMNLTLKIFYFLE